MLMAKCVHIEIRFDLAHGPLKSVTDPSSIALPLAFYPHTSNTKLTISTKLVPRVPYLILTCHPFDLLSTVAFFEIRNLASDFTSLSIVMYVRNYLASIEYSLGWQAESC